MKKLLLLILPVLLLCAGCTFTNNTNSQGGSMDKKILIAYFSWGGNTKSIAEKIHKQTGGDMFEIKPVTPYPNDYREVAYGIAKEQKEKNIHPEITNKDVSGYDVIFVGTPAWWYTMAPPVMTFLEQNKFEGKTVVPFITHGGGGKYSIAQDMANLAKGAKVVTEPLVIYERGDSNTEKEITGWLKKIKY